jgi:hypothetical protein
MIPLPPFSVPYGTEFLSEITQPSVGLEEVVG